MVTACKHSISRLDVWGSAGHSTRRTGVMLLHPGWVSTHSSFKSVSRKWLHHLKV